MYKLNKMNYSKINVTKMNYCEISKYTILPKRITILQFMCVISYSYIYYIIYKRIITSLKKKDEDKVDEEEKEEENLTLIRPVDEEETLQIYEFEGTGEQLRRLRAYNPKNDYETEEDYISRIWSMADKEDEEEKKEREIKRKEKMEEKNVNAWYIINNGQSRYKGEWKNGLPNGKGSAEIFEGLNKDSNGTPCDSNGNPCCWCMIEGNFVNGVVEGYAKQIYKQEEHEEIQPYYEGEFKNNKHHGQGAYYYGTGEYHKGNFKEAKFHGMGCHYYVKKNMSWVGEFDNDKLTRGAWIVGELDQIEDKVVKVEVTSSSEAEEKDVVKVEDTVEHKVQEKAEEKDINTWYTVEDRTARYKGEWKNGLPNGKGIKHFYKTDSYIEGSFVDSFAEGYGKQIFQQTWEKTVPYYEGEFKRNQWQGKGEYHYGDGDYYKGMWKDSKYHGQGTAYSNRLDRTWVGEYNNDEKVEGNWVNGEI